MKNKPILFIDDKIDNGVPRYKEHEDLIYELGGAIESIEFLSKVDFTQKSIFNDRELVFIHASTENEIQPEFVNDLKGQFPNIIFAEFSGNKSSNFKNLKDLRFRRKEHIYADGGVRLYLFLKFRQLYNKSVLSILITNGDFLGQIFEKSQLKIQEDILELIRLSKFGNSQKEIENLKNSVRLLALKNPEIENLFQDLETSANNASYINSLNLLQEKYKNYCDISQQQLSKMLKPNE